MVRNNPLGEEDRSASDGFAQSNRRSGTRAASMAPETLVSFDIESGNKVIDALDRDGKTPNVYLKDAFVYRIR
jgi:hypothetical protein